MREARAAGINDARTAAATSTPAAPATGTAPGSRTSGMKLPTERASRTPADRSRDDPDPADRRPFPQDPRQQVARRGADGQPDPELSGARADRKRQHARDADDRDHQRDGGEPAEHERVETVRREHLRADVFERCRLLHRLVRATGRG